MGIKELLQKFGSDKEFAAKYQALPSLNAFLAQAKEDGYSVTKEDVIASGELSDESLEGAAGGVIPVFTYVRPPKEV